jgi:hypothetical protein
MANNLDTTLRVIPVKPSEDLMMRQAIGFLSNEAFREPCSDDRIIILQNPIEIDQSSFDISSRASPTSLLLTGTES